MHFREAGSDDELLERVLFRAIPQRDVKPLAKKLIAKARLLRRSRGGAAHALEEDERRRRRPQSGASGGEPLGARAGAEAALLSPWGSVLDYCRMAQSFADKEQFRVLFLDKRNQLIADKLQQVGTIDHTTVHPREVVKRALELSATALILVHNHPAGDPAPSRADIQITQAIVEVAKPLGIAVHNHIVVGKEGHASFKGLSLI